MRQLYPELQFMALEDLYVELVADVRPALRLGMVASVDGATALDGVSGGLGGVADRQAFRALRASADVVIVGAGTARAENYGPIKLAREWQEARLTAGRTSLPRLAVVTATGLLDPDARLFREAASPIEGNAEPPILLVAPPAFEAARDRFAGLAEVRELPDADIASGVARLQADGLPSVLCEGGPTINGLLAQAGVVTEVFLTVAPKLVSGRSKRVLAGTSSVDSSLTLRSVFEHEGELLLRYERLD